MATRNKKKQVAPKQWIQKATAKMEEKGTVGSLHKALGVPEGEKIPAKKLAAACKSKDPAIRKKANFAKSVRKSKRK